MPIAAGHKSTRDPDASAVEERNRRKGDEAFHVLLKPFDTRRDGLEDPEDREDSYEIDDVSEHDLLLEGLSTDCGNITLQNHTSPGTCFQHTSSSHSPRSAVAKTVSVPDLSLYRAKEGAHQPDIRSAVTWAEQSDRFWYGKSNPMSSNWTRIEHNAVSRWLSQSTHEEPFPLVFRTSNAETANDHY